VIAALLSQPQPPLTPVIVKVVPAPTKEIEVIDLLLGSFGIVGLVLFGSALLGLALGWLFIRYRKRQDAMAPDEPPLNPYQLNLTARNRERD
jgi:ABC-type Fe3+ transport system permease subunit